MRLGKCLVSSDLNPLYLDFFPITFRAWRDLVGVEAQLILISDHIPSALKSYDKHIILVPPIRGVHTGFQAQCVRILMPQLCEVADDQAILISDIDMVPMNSHYYLESIADVPEQNFVIYRSDALSHLEEIAICYNAASPKSWRELVGEIRDIDDMRDRIEEWSSAANYDGHHGGSGWSTDQRLLYEFISKFDPKRVTRFTDASLNFYRLDRIHIKNRLKVFQKYLVRRHFYADYHMKRPFDEYAELNERIVDLVIGGQYRYSPWNRILYRFFKKR